MSVRPLLSVFGLTLGDYLLWHWSLNSHHDTLALIAGLTLPPLGAACVWLGAVLATRALARHTRAAARLAPRAMARRRRDARPGPERLTASSPAAASASRAARQDEATGRAAGRSSGRLAA